MIYIKLFELQVGSWILFNNEPVKIWSINDHGVTFLYNGKPMYRTLLDRIIDGLPIDHDLIEALGFEVTEEHDPSKEYTSEIHGLGNVSILFSYQGDYWVEIISDDELECVKKRVNSIHEIQREVSLATGIMLTFRENFENNN